MVLLLHQQCGWSVCPGRPAVCVRFPILRCSLFYSRIAQKRLLAFLIFVIYYEHVLSRAVGAGLSSNKGGIFFSTSPERLSKKRQRNSFNCKTVKLVAAVYFGGKSAIDKVALLLLQ